MNKEESRKEEIDLIEIIKIVWSRKIFIGWVLIVFFGLGVIVAFTARVEYKTSCRLMPESQEGSAPDLGGLGGLAGLAGINLDLGSSGSLTPELYPEIVRSAPFLDELLNTEVFFERKDTTISSFNYFKHLSKPTLLEVIGEYTIGLPSKVKGLFSSGEEAEISSYGMLRYSREDWKIFSEFLDRMKVTVDPITGIIDVTTEMPDAVASAQVTALMINLLTEKVTGYKVEKAQSNLDFIQERFDEARINYEEKQNQLARFADKNRNLSNSLVQNEYQRLQNELDIAFEVFKGLANQLEQSKIKLKEETPVFSILEPVKIPADKNKPKRVLIIFMMTFIGGVLASAFILIKSKLFPYLK